MVEKLPWNVTARAYVREAEEETVVGTIEFKDGLVRVTDPCHGQTSQCGLKDVRIVPGLYEFHIYSSDDEDDPRPSVCGVYRLDGNTEKLVDFDGWEVIGTVAVDSGLAGIFERKPDFTEDEEDRFDRNVSHGSAWIFTGERLHGVCSESGCGDSTYEVQGYKSDPSLNAFEAIEITF